MQEIHGAQVVMSGRGLQQETMITTTIVITVHKGLQVSL